MATGTVTTGEVARVIKRPTEQQVLSQLVSVIEGAIDLWLDQERRITVKDIRAWQAVIQDVAGRLSADGRAQDRNDG